MTDIEYSDDQYISDGLNNSGQTVFTNLTLRRIKVYNVELVSCCFDCNNERLTYDRPNRYCVLTQKTLDEDLVYDTIPDWCPLDNIDDIIREEKISSIVK